MMRLQVRTMALLLWRIARDRNHDAMYCTDCRRVASRMYMLYGTVQGGLQECFRSVIKQYADDLGTLKERKKEVCAIGTRNWYCESVPAVSGRSSRKRPIDHSRESKRYDSRRRGGGLCFSKACSFCPGNTGLWSLKSPSSRTAIFHRNRN
jgi:hypothetical protein